MGINPPSPLRALSWLASLVLLSCAAPGRRISVYVDPDHSRKVNIGLNVLTGTDEIGPCVPPSEVPTADTTQAAFLQRAVRGWESEEYTANTPFCVKWFSQTKDGLYVSLQNPQHTVDGGWLAYQPRAGRSPEEAWVMVPW